MKTITVSTYGVEMKLATLLNEVEQLGYYVRTCRDGEPIADLVPVKKKANRIAANPELKDIKFHEDPLAPLQPGDWIEDRNLR